MGRVRCIFSELFFEVDEEPTNLGEAVDDLLLGVFKRPYAELFAYAVEGISAVASEVTDTLQEVDILLVVGAHAAFVLHGTQLAELRLPEAQHRLGLAQHLGHFADRII